jgi:hypothetical protein
VPPESVAVSSTFGLVPAFLQWPLAITSMINDPVGTPPPGATGRMESLTYFPGRPFGLRSRGRGRMNAPSGRRSVRSDRPGHRELSPVSGPVNIRPFGDDAVGLRQRRSVALANRGTVGGP